MSRAVRGPERDVGLATWNAFHGVLRMSQPHPVLRIPAPSPSP